MTTENRNDQYKPPAPAETPAGADLTDAFRNDEATMGRILPFSKENKHERNWADLLTMDECRMLALLGERISKLMVDMASRKPPGTVIPPHPNVVMADLAVIHLAKNGLDLARMIEADDLLLAGTYAQAAPFIDRVTTTLRPNAVMNFPLRPRSLWTKIAARLHH